MADIFVYLNIVGALYTLFHSIVLRRLLVRMTIDLDKKEVSPSDFAIVVRNLPKGVTKDDLKSQIEAKFTNVIVSYVNLCYDITTMIELNKKISELSK